ncbi:MAG: hypothetical protein K0S71_2458 [Clostridia bacterium]|nr:hypothetical protein [Clostridia bacterium]
MGTKRNYLRIAVMLCVCSILLISANSCAKKDETVGSNKADTKKPAVKKPQNPKADKEGVESSFWQVPLYRNISIISGSVILLTAGGSVVFFAYKRRKRKDGKTVKLDIPKENKLSFSFANIQNIGKRESQQDSFGVSNIENKEYVDKKGILAIVADGMGGLAYGKEISEKAVEFMLRGFENMSLGESCMQQLLSLVHTLNAQIYNQYQMEGGTTLVAVYIIDNRFYWMSVGDSTIYLKRDGILYQLNKEHIHLNTLYLKVLEDKMSIDEALSDKEKNALTEFIGKDVLTEIDFNTKPFKIKAGDRLMLCSDGISSYLAESEISEALEQDINVCCSTLESMVLSKKYPYQDNLTGLVIECR